MIWQTEFSKGRKTELFKGRIWKFDSSKLDCQKKNQCSKLKGCTGQFDPGKLKYQKEDQFGKLSCQKDLLGNLVSAN